MLTLIDISATQYTHIDISKLLSMLIILVIFGCFQLKLLQTAPLILNVIITNYSKHLCLLIISDKKQIMSNFGHIAQHIQRCA